jgi:hypothetical protein
MTHWQQGRPDAARRYYALAAPGLARTGHAKRFRDEAVALMNPGGGPKAPAADPPPKP